MKPNIIYFCGGKSCCPALIISEESDDVNITDDFGGSVKLTKHQLNELKDKLNDISDRQSLL